MANDNMELPPGVVTSDDIPETLYWLLRVEKYGPLYSGGQARQPVHFVKDLEYAEIGRNRYRRTKEANSRNTVAQEDEGPPAKRIDLMSRFGKPGSA